MSRFRVSLAASQDLESIWEYIAADNLDAADQLIEQLRATIVWLARYPGAGHMRRDLGNRSVLFWAEGRYEIVYRVFGGEIEIDAVLHGSRDIPAVLREREADD
jgi:toxin ParE1/3/4